MEGIEFEDDKNQSVLSEINSQATVRKPSFMIKLLEKVGVTGKATANFVLLGITVIFFGIAFFIYSGLLNEDTNPSQTVEQGPPPIYMLNQ